MDSILHFFKSMLANETEANGFPLIYKGEINHQLMRSFAFMAKRKMEDRDIPTQLRKRVFHIVIECLQNITKHSDDFDYADERVGNGLFVIGEEKDSFYVITANLINNEKVDSLKNRIEQINASEKSKLKKMFLKQLMEGEFNDRGGAGLGLIDIARKSGNPLNYHFVPTQEDQHYFLLWVSIPSETVATS